MCGYDRCHRALHFHHIDPSRKEFTFGKVMANPKSWDKIVTEMRKCALLCANCHAELHDGLIDLPTWTQVFDKSLIPASLFNTPKSIRLKPCVICGTGHENKKYCSRECYWKYLENPRKPTKATLKRLIDSGASWRAMGSRFNVSDNGVRKWAVTYGLI